MPQRILVDTNVIIAAHRYNFWTHLTNEYAVETVLACVVETQTGASNRNPEDNIDQQELVASLAAPPHQPTRAQRAHVSLLGGDKLDAGEFDLWAYALADADAWMLASPDGVSVDFGFEVGHRDRLVSLESLVKDRNQFRSKGVRAPFTEEWLRNRISKRLMGLL